MRRILAAVLLFTFAPTLVAARFDDMDYGPFLSHTFQLPNNNITLRGIAVPFDAPIDGDVITPGVKGKAAVNPGKCGIIFDTELLRYSGYWNGGFITWNGVVFNGAHGSNPGPAGKILVATKATPGWAMNGKFDDPRPIPHGPLPREWARYKGLHRSDKGIVFAYTVGNVDVLDMPSVVVQDKQRVFCRTLNISASKEPLQVVLADVPGVSTTVEFKGDKRRMNLGGPAENYVVAEVFGGPKETALDFSGGKIGRLVLKIPASDTSSQIKISLWSGPATELDVGDKAVQKTGELIDLAPLKKGGKARFNETVTTKGVRGDDKD